MPCRTGAIFADPTTIGGRIPEIGGIGETPDLRPPSSAAEVAQIQRKACSE